MSWATCDIAPHATQQASQPLVTNAVYPTLLALQLFLLLENAKVSIGISILLSWHLAFLSWNSTPFSHGYIKPPLPRLLQQCTTRSLSSLHLLLFPVLGLVE